MALDTYLMFAGTVAGNAGEVTSVMFCTGTMLNPIQLMTREMKSIMNGTRSVAISDAFRRNSSVACRRNYTSQ